MKIMISLIYRFFFVIFSSPLYLLLFLILRWYYIVYILKQI